MTIIILYNSKNVTFPILLLVREISAGGKMFPEIVLEQFSTNI